MFGTPDLRVAGFHFDIICKYLALLVSDLKSMSIEERYYVVFSLLLIMCMLPLPKMYFYRASACLLILHAECDSEFLCGEMQVKLITICGILRHIFQFTKILS